MDINLDHSTQGEPVNVLIPEMLEERFKAAAQRQGLSEKEFAALLIQKGFSVLGALEECFPE